tara:strand:- start:37964 stop:38203 length:240 start_codon:yes stop_codon:yes gene_type:complete
MLAKDICFPQLNWQHKAGFISIRVLVADSPGKSAFFYRDIIPDEERIAGTLNFQMIPFYLNFRKNLLVMNRLNDRRSPL